MPVLEEHQKIVGRKIEAERQDKTAGDFVCARGISGSEICCFFAKRQGSWFRRAEIGRKIDSKIGS